MYEIRETDRIAMTRMHLGSHKLKVETGRWARIQLDFRTCPCNTGIQNEHHVLLTCPMSQNLRKIFHPEKFNNMAEFFQYDTKQLAEYCNLTVYVLIDAHCASPEPWVRVYLFCWRSEIIKLFFGVVR